MVVGLKEYIYTVYIYGSEAFCTAPITGKLLHDTWAEGTFKPLPLQVCFI